MSVLLHYLFVWSNPCLRLGVSIHLQVLVIYSGSALIAIYRYLLELLCLLFSIVSLSLLLWHDS